MRPHRPPAEPQHGKAAEQPQRRVDVGEPRRESGKAGRRQPGIETVGERRAEAAANEPKEVSPLAGVLQHEPAGDAAVNLAPAQPSELPQATIDEMNAGKAALARNKPKAG